MRQAAGGAGGFPTCLGCGFRRLREGSADRGRAQTRVKMSPPFPVVVSQFQDEVICRSYKPFYNPQCDACDDAKAPKVSQAGVGISYCR